MENWSLHKKQEMVDNGELEKEGVWSAAKAREVNVKSKVKSVSSSSPSTAWQHSTMPRAILRGSKTHEGGSYASFAKRSSAPVNIPDWSKVYGKKQKRKKNGKTMVSGGEDDDSDGNGHYHDHNEDEDGDGDEEDEGVMLPPHEWLARKLARSQISSFSVFEGVGRTLKGRDLSRVRDAILTKTGFLE